MPDPAHFPPEITTHIFDCATNDNRDAKSLARFCRVNRQWNALARPRLYLRWTYHGEKHSIGSLWRFLCSVIRNHQIASLVQSVDVRNWAFPNEDLGPDFQVDVAPEEVALVQQAFRAAGIDGMDNCTMTDLRQGDRNPFMALLFTRLPNLSRVSAHVPAYDAFLGGVLHRALMDHNDRPPMQAFQNLKELSVLSEWARPHWEGPGIPNDLYRLGLECLAPIFSLPRLEKLSIFGLDAEDALHHCGPRPGTSSIKHLTLVNHQYATATAPETQAILAMPKALTSLSFYQNDCGIVPPEPEDPLPVSNAQIFSALRQHRKSLEHLDIYRDCTGTSPHVHHKNISHFGSLHEFERLKKVCIQPEALLGGCFGEPKAPFRLKDTLPASLESLTFYGSNGLILDLGLAEQFREILLSGDFTHLKSIIFEDVSEFVSCFIPSYVSRPNQAVKEICKEARVTFQERKGHHFLKGGKRLPWFMQACRMRTLREHKREILTDDEDLSEENPSDSEYDVPRPNSGDLNLETESLNSDKEVDWEDESSDLGSEELDSGDELDSLSDDWNEEVVDEDA